MEPVGTYDYTTEAYGLDFMGRLPMPTLGNYLLHAATQHAEERDFGYAEMERRGTAWVLSRLAIELVGDGRELADPICVSTWVEAVERTRRPTSLAGEWFDRMMAPGLPCPVETAGRIAAAEESADGEPTLRTVRYSDLDINGHLNSMRHMEAILDGFDLEVYRAAPVRHFEISYHAEGRYGRPLALYRRTLAPGIFACALVDEGRAISRAEIRFA